MKISDMTSTEVRDLIYKMVKCRLEPYFLKHDGSYREKSIEERISKTYDEVIDSLLGNNEIKEKIIALDDADMCIQKAWMFDQLVNEQWFEIKRIYCVNRVGILNKI